MKDHHEHGDLSCQELVELVTDHVEGDLPPELQARVDDHLATCDGCTTVVAQWREVIRLTGRLGHEDVDQALDPAAPATRAALQAAFRQARNP